MLETIAYILAIFALIFGPAGLYMSLIEAFPIKWVYYHYKIKKPINWAIVLLVLLVAVFITVQNRKFEIWTFIPWFISIVGLLLAYKAHQSQLFKEIDFPPMAVDIAKLPIEDQMQMAVVEYGGITKCYPLNYVKTHHIVNDKFSDKIVSLTFCAHCNGFIPFDVTAIGPLFAGSMKGGNLIVADKKTATFFQQATFKSIAGKLHPAELTMIPYQIIPWREVKILAPQPMVVQVTKKDLKDFEILIKGVWKKIQKTEFTLGISKKNRNKEFPARTRVIGLLDPFFEKKVAYIKDELIKKKIVQNDTMHFVLIVIEDTVIGFKSTLNTAELNLKLYGNIIRDEISKTEWNLQGKHLNGKINKNLEYLSLSDEFWFSWKKFNPNSELIRL
ncbi:DUF3179 domain-containing (seleno)protein [Arenibacter sp. GZD96]|uniref:DUF3179 domain-containing (seleno)protein n=1 Tax=Aurantibrevibacter litoralis TaxID=3106030 RepID=UPI002B0000AE|nr:DUF3179 domain-containing (seleno)protein [Arenibacter sp. GZD-96]MEA1785415.1 DUF3179 domain-containing (seleno)protein [Arenibacter sp. GZD-96]